MSPRTYAIFVISIFGVTSGCDSPATTGGDSAAADVALSDVHHADGADGDATVDAAPDTADTPTDTDSHDTVSAADADGGSDPGEPHVVVAFDRDWIHTEVEGGAVVVGCRYRNAEGHPMEDPGDFEVTTAAAEAIVQGDSTFAFEDAGAYSFTCASASLGLSATRDLVVAFEGIDYRFVETSQLLSSYGPVLENIIARNAGLDVDGYAEAVDRLEGLASQFPDLSGVGLLTDNPHGWPTVQDLRDAGLTDGADDVAWTSALAELTEAIANERVALEQLGASPTEADLAALESAAASTRLAHESMAVLEPSEIAVWAHRDEVAQLMAEMAATAKVRSARLAAMFRAAPPTPSFSLVGTLSSIAIKEAVGSYSYKSILTDVGKSVVANMISVTIKNLINRGFVPTADSPRLGSIHGSAAGFVGAEIPFTAAGSFNSDFNKMKIIFIPPTISNELAGIVDIVGSVDGITQQRNVLKLVNTLRKLIKQLIDTFQAAATADEMFIVLTPDSGDEEFLHFPALPTGLNCSRFQVPVAGTMLPIDFDWGRGEAVNVNVLGEPSGNCGN
jgi:hypothetical protein